MDFKYIILSFLYILRFGQPENIVISREISLEKIDCKIKECANKDYSIFHFQARIQKTYDIIHYFVSTIKTPAIIVSHTVVKSKLSVNWNNIIRNESGGILFSPPANTSGALTFSRLMEYEDTDDTVKMANIIGDVLQKFDWHFVSDRKDHVVFMANSSETSGQLGFEVKVFGNSGYDTVLPGEPFNSNSSKFTLSFDNLNTTKKKSRYAVELMYLNDGATHQKPPTFHTSKSIDDEHTPGIFKVVTLNISVSAGGTFAMWKPVAYSSHTRSRDSQVLVYTSPSGDGTLNKVQSHPWSIADTYMGKGKAYGMNYTMGLNGDGFYNGTKYIGWTAVMGFGKPPEDKISTLVIIIISVGLGLPAVLILIGGTGMCCRRCIKRRQMQYQQIN